MLASELLLRAVAGDGAAARELGRVLDSLAALLAGGARLEWGQRCGEAEVAAAESTSSTSYADLATAGPEVTVTVGASGIALVLWTALVTPPTNDVAYVAVWVDGANPSNAQAARLRDNNGVAQTLTKWCWVTGLAAGPHTFGLCYRVSGGSGTFADRGILALPMEME